MKKSELYEMVALLAGRVADLENKAAPSQALALRVEALEDVAEELLADVRELVGDEDDEITFDADGHGFDEVSTEDLAEFLAEAEASFDEEDANEDEGINVFVFVVE